MLDLRSKFPDYYQYHGRNISKKLSLSNVRILNDYYSKYSLDKKILNISSKTSTEQLLQSNLFKKVIIEVGFGDGEHLIESALSNPKVLFVGSEVYVNGVAKVLKQILEYDIKNIRLCGMNFVYLLNILNQNSIDELKIINPDPWHKKRHSSPKQAFLDFPKCYTRETVRSFLPTSPTRECGRLDTYMAAVTVNQGWCLCEVPTIGPCRTKTPVRSTSVSNCSRASKHL